MSAFFGGGRRIRRREDRTHLIHDPVSGWIRVLLVYGAFYCKAILCKVLTTGRETIRRNEGVPMGLMMRGSSRNRNAVAFKGGFRKYLFRGSQKVRQQHFGKNRVPERLEKIGYLIF